MLSEYPDDNFNKSLALHTLGDIYKLRDNNDEAIKYYKQALDHEIIYPNVKTQAYIDYAELIIKTGLFDQFDFVENILLERVPEILFPLTKYKAFSILAIIYNHKDKPDQAKEYIDLAELNASAETSGLRYHKYLGVVKDRDSVLDRLVKRD